MSEHGLRADDATMGTWAELALKVRAYQRIMNTVSSPDDGTAFELADDSYPPESVSQWCREGIRSALDHLGMWADYTVPLQQFPGQVVHHGGFRWTYTLMRAAIEGAAQSIWLSDSASVQEAVARLVRMVRHDLDEEGKAFRADGRDVAAIEARLAKHEAAAALLTAFGTDTPHLPSMVDLVRNGAKATGLDPDRFEFHWRVCSAAAHGKDWAIRELQILPQEAEEWRPGQFHFKGHVNAKMLTDALSDSVELVTLAVGKYLHRSTKADLDLLIRRAIYDAAKATPQKDDGSTLRRLAKEFGYEDDEELGAPDPGVVGPQ
ncbi:hypothetical protein BH10ACT6_BH10ACT6_01570 [soil metagenome]